MSPVIDNRGIVNVDGTVNVTRSVVGDRGVVIAEPRTERRRAAAGRGDRCDVGVVTVLAVEAKAVAEVLGLRPAKGAGRQRFSTGTVDAAGRAVRVVMARTTASGQRPVMAALEHLRRSYEPAVLALIGIGGGVHPTVALDDVVVATQVVYYDLRKVTPAGVRRRGESREAPASTVHAVNAFFTAHGDPAELRVETNPEAPTFRVFHGPIGSGDAVVADEASEVRTYLSDFNDKVLAVDMEAGGLGQYCYEASGSGPGDVVGWVVIRGIADHADGLKDDTRHASAALHAAQVLRDLLPHLLPA